MSNLFKLNLTNFKSALVTVFLTAVLAMAVYVIGLGDVFLIEKKTLVNIGVMSVLNGLVSLIKAFLTTSKGNFLGTVKVHPAK